MKGSLRYPDQGAGVVGWDVRNEREILLLSINRYFSLDREGAETKRKGPPTISHDLWRTLSHKCSTRCAHMYMSATYI